ncbi:DMT family transporter [Oceaniradius stylonematis]|uniref:DMT family transporter n=1 Tax=Oceaniradius stylonematis TaxID=2184161 RepID=UPI00273DEE0C|nr:DMT family transporter [Oceaniradius stylonematis]
MSQDRNVPLGFALGLVGIVIFGATLPATVFALEVYGPLFIASARAVVAGVLSLIVLLSHGRTRLFRPSWRLLLAGAMVTFGFPAFSSLGMVSVPASDGGVVLGILPLATAMFAALLTAERPGAVFWAWAVAGSVLVVWFVIGQDGGAVRDFSNPGYLWLLASAVSAALGYVVMAELSKSMPGWEVICRVLIACLPFNLAISWFLWEPEYAFIETVPALALGYHAVFSMFLGFFAWNAGLALGGIARVGQIQLMQIFVTIGLSVWLLGETVTLRTLIFACAVAATVWFGRRARIG